MRIGVDVHFDRTVADGFADFRLRRAGAAVEDEIDRLGGEATFFGDVFLGSTEDARFELDVAGFIHAVDVAEGGRDGETRADRA